MGSRPGTVIVAVCYVITLAACAAVPRAGLGTPTPEPSPPVASPPTRILERLHELTGHPDALIIGDSFTEGYGASSPAGGWANLAASSLQWNATIDGVGGTGFVDAAATDGRTGLDYLSRIAAHEAAGGDYAVVVLQGGLNDSAAEPAVEAAHVRAAVAAALRAWPDAVILVFGRTSPDPARTRHEDAIRTAAVASGAVYIDPREPRPWINSSNSDTLDYGDGLHLNDVGYAYLAARFVAAVQELSD